MLTVVWVWQVDELALRRNGEETTDPLAGAETVMSAANPFVERPKMKMIISVKNAHLDE
jgi:hypothetical protein